MKKRCAGLAAAGMFAGALALGGGVAEAAPSENGACVQAGLGTLKDLGLLQAAAQKQID